ncbi:MAG: hypothetical protein GEV06_00400 [Luteitalea sp.]|nr:hypothetical protein [Luteitalea sp.]
MRATRPWDPPVLIVLLGVVAGGCDLATGAFSSQASDQRVDGRLGGGGPPLSLETVNGGIDVTGR